MTDEIHIVYTSGIDGEAHPYGAFTEIEAARQAREAIIKDLEDTATDVLDSLDPIHALEGSLEEQIRITSTELFDEFDGDLDELFEDAEDILNEGREGLED